MYHYWQHTRSQPLSHSKKKFDVITMLAVIEHIKPIEFRELLSEFRNYTTEQSIVLPLFQQ